MASAVGASLLPAPLFLGGAPERPALAVAAVQDHLDVLVVRELLPEDMVEILPVGRHDAEVAGPGPIVQCPHDAAPSVQNNLAGSPAECQPFAIFWTSSFDIVSIRNRRCFTFPSDT